MTEEGEARFMARMLRQRRRPCSSSAPFSPHDTPRVGCVSGCIPSLCSGVAVAWCSTVQHGGMKGVGGATRFINAWLATPAHPPTCAMHIHPRNYRILQAPYAVCLQVETTSVLLIHHVRSVHHSFIHSCIIDMIGRDDALSPPSLPWWGTTHGAWPFNHTWCMAHQPPMARIAV